MMSLTAKQAELLEYISYFLAESGGVAPSFEQMKLALNLKSKSGVHRLVDALEERGRIVRAPNRARAIRVIPDGIFAGVPTTVLIAELARRGEANAEARKAA